MILPHNSNLGTKTLILIDSASIGDKMPLRIIVGIAGTMKKMKSWNRRILSSFLLLYPMFRNKENCRLYLDTSLKILETKTTIPAMQSMNAMYNIGKVWIKVIPLSACIAILASNQFVC